MIAKHLRRGRTANEVEAKGFDAFELRLGDLMRGERATLGKSLLDLQRELKIKAAYIAAIENCDPTAFDTPGFIAGYVRSYARYLAMDPDWAFETFCRESGFQTAHGMSKEASPKRTVRDINQKRDPADMFASPSTPFVPAGESVWSRVEPSAIGSVLVLVALIGGLGYGGWTVLQEVQKVRLAPVEQTPYVVSDLDPLAGNAGSISVTGDEALFAAPSAEALDRLYRPQALDTPVMIARDGPISTLDPNSIGALVADNSADAVAAAVAEAAAEPGAVQVTEAVASGLEVVAVRPSWVRVTSVDGSVIYEGIMNAGDSYAPPQTEAPAEIRVGESGAVYFALNGTHYGPVGQAGTVTSGVTLSPDYVTGTYAVANLDADSDLAAIVAVAEAQTGQ